MALFPISEKSQAYADGYKNGRTDRALGLRIDYSWFGATVETADSYSRNYSLGYRQGWTGQQF